MKLRATSDRMSQYVTGPSISKLISTNQVKLVDSLSTDAQVLFGFLSLIVDIRYRNRYGENFTDQHGKGYSDDVHVLAD